MHVKVTNGTPEIYSIGQLRRDNPNVSFPKNPSDELLANWNVYELIQLDRPDIDNNTQSCVVGEITEVNGVWQRGWVVENKPLEEAENAIRNHRNFLLSITDWMALSDVTMSQAWIDYRQALRDVTAQEGFPYNVVWPTEPV